MPAAWRSLLFVPGNAPEKLAKAAGRGADAIIIDLEDAVSLADKSSARAGLPDHVAVLAGQGVDVLVRINAPWRMAVADLTAAVRPGVAALMVPKAEDPARLAVLAAMLAEWEDAAGLPAGGIGLLPLVETPAGILRAAEIAAAPRLIGLTFGSEDFSAALGVDPTPLVLDHPCRQLALAAAAHGLPAFGLPLSLAQFRDLDAYAAGATQARALGLSGGLCIHPAQVPVLNRCFQPTEAQLTAAHAIMALWEEAQARGQAVAALNGAMIDRPVVERARRLLAGRPSLA